MQPHFLRLLILMKFGDRMGRKFHGLAHVRRQSFFGGGKISLGCCNFIMLHRSFVELTRKPGQRLITLIANGLHDRFHFGFES